MSERECLYAYTEVGGEHFYPAFVNLSREADGSVVLTVRSADNAGFQQGSIKLGYAQLVSLAEVMKYDAARANGAGG